MSTAIIGLGKIGTAVADHLTVGARKSSWRPAHRSGHSSLPATWVRRRRLPTQRLGWSARIR